MSDLQKIREARADLARQRAALERRDAELAVAEKVLAEFGDVTVSTPPQSVQQTQQRTLDIILSSPPASRRERVLQALSGEKVWMTSAEINRAIAKRHGMLIKGTSLYPMLTVLKNEGVIVRDGDKMALKSRVEGGSEVQD